MDEEIERLIVSVRADTGGFARDVAEMRGQLEGPLAAGADRAGRAIENALLRAVSTGKFGFEDLKRLALQVMADIAAAAVRSGIASLSGGGSGGGGGGAGGTTASLISLGTSIAAAIFGAPGRATGGPVAPGRPYLVGERGPELFVPTAGGRIETGRGGSGRDVNVRISINAPEAREPQALARSSRQVARAVKQALTRIED
jgi:phage-related minor tail protein